MASKSPNTGKRLLLGYRASSPVVITSDSESDMSMSSKKRKVGSQKYSGMEKKVSATASKPPRSVIIKTPFAYTEVKEDPGKEEGDLGVVASNLERWEQLDYEMILGRDLVLRYVKQEMYDLAFDKSDSVREILKKKVGMGVMSPQRGLSEYFDHLRGLLDVHASVVRAKGDHQLFRSDDLREAVVMMEMIETETYETGYYGMEKKLPRSEETESETETEDDDLTPEELALICMAARETGYSYRTVGHVGGPEEFGDPEYSSDEDDSMESDITSSGSEASVKMEYDAGKKAQRKEFTKLLKRYDVGLTLLPELVRDRVDCLIQGGYHAIDYRGYTAERALADIFASVGHLHTNAEVRKRFLESTLTNDLDG